MTMARDDATASPARARASLGIADVMVKDETRGSGCRRSRFSASATRWRGCGERGNDVTDLACATAGNHGRAVARVARERGLEAHVYVPIGTSPERIAALRAEDAHVVVTTVDYDETVRLMARDAAA